MKKITLLLLIFAVCFTLAGCNNTSKAMEEFNSQLETVEDVLSSTNTNEISDLSSIYGQQTKSDNILQTYNNISFENVQREESLRHDVLALNSILKSSTKAKLKLTKSQLNALSDLSKTLKTNVEQFKNSKSSFKSSSNALKKSLKSNKTSLETKSKYLSLNNVLMSRYVYLNNIFNTLEFAYDFFENGNLIDFKNINVLPPETNTDSQNEESKMKKNIDSYLPNNNQNNAQPQTNQNYMNNRYPINVPPYMPSYNMPNGYGYNYPFMGNPYYGGYGYNNMFNRFNPSRNTDTFYPYERNIDTYRLPTNMNNGLNNLGNAVYPVNAEATENEDETFDTLDEDCCESETPENCCESETPENCCESETPENCCEE